MMHQLATPTVRQLGSWIDAFMDYSDVLSSPQLFRKWAAIATVAGALERKVWVRTLGSNLYPNLYTILIGPPGVGKTMVLDEVAQLWTELPEHHTAPSSVSAASLIDALKDAERRILRPQENPNFVQFNSLLIPSNELGVFMPAYDADFMSRLTDLYDGKRYSERRRTKDIKIQIDHPQINLLAATTPSFINGMLPEGAWDQGFLSRVIMIYSGENTPRDLFVEQTRDTTRREALAKELKVIGNMYGKFQFDEDAGAALNRWHMAKGPPSPEHPKLVNYNSRRTAHILKLSMIASASRGSDYLIKMEDFQTALSWLLEAEMYMPDVFRSMGSGGDAKAIEDAWYFVYALFGKTKEPVQEHKLVAFLSERIPSHSVMRVIELMVKSNRLSKGIDVTGLPNYKPRAKTEF